MLSLAEYLNNSKPDALDWRFILSEFSKPFAEGQIKFRANSGSSLAYIDSRELADRLNLVVGPENWSDEYFPFQVLQTETSKVPRRTPEGKDLTYKGRYKEEAAFEVNEINYPGVRCVLSIFGVSKSDAGNPANAEPVKSQFSDALA